MRQRTGPAPQPPGMNIFRFSRTIGLVTGGPQTYQLDQLASHGAGRFLIVWVLLPSVLGIAGRRLLGEVRSEVAVYGSGGFTSYSTG